MCRIKGLAFIIAVLMGTYIIGCGPEYPNCDEDEDCREGEFCVNNRCQQCRDSGDCAQGKECVEGACNDIPGYCTQSSDCSDGQVCRNNRCSPCMSADECTGDLVCLNGKCQKGECRTNEDCPAGLICMDYACKPDPNLTPQSDSACNLESLYFDFDSSELKPEARRTLEENYECLTKSGGNVVLEGHCDPRGTTEYNMALGERRAKIVRKMLSNLGFDESKANLTSKGEEEATGTDEESWARDRRVDFR